MVSRTKKNKIDNYKVVSITYGDKKYRNAGKLCIKTAVKSGKVDQAILYSPQDIDGEFFVCNKKILEQKKGNGYWLWKPYFILKTLGEMNEGDVLIYTDAGDVYIDDVHYLIRQMMENNDDKMIFSLESGRTDRKYTKRDALLLIGADCENIIDTRQADASMLIFVNNSSNRSFVKQWLDYCCDYRILTDSENELAVDNYPEFLMHRHDQSVLSIMAKLSGINFYIPPDNWGKEMKKNSEQYNCRPSDYPQIINHHRSGKVRTIIGVKFIQSEFYLKASYKMYLWRKQHGLVE